MEEQKKETKENNGKGKQILFIVIAVIVIALIIAGIAFAIYNNKPKSNVQISSTEDMQNLINNVYEGLETTLPPTLNTQVIDVSNTDVLKSFTGLTSNQDVDMAVVSEPMIGSQAYSFVLVKVKDGADADKVAKAMSENIDTRKWICVSADKLYATSVDNLALLVMSSDEWATPVYNKVKEILGAHNEEYTKVTSDELPDEGLAL